MPWTRLVETLGDARFEEIHAALEQARTDPFDRDAFLLNGAAGLLLRDLMPADAPAAAVNAYGALLHMLYCAWSRDWPLARLTAVQLKSAIASAATASRALLPIAHSPLPVVVYLQLPERLVWAEPAAGQPHEPLDGVFLLTRPARAWIVAILGFREGRDGFTTIEAAMALPAPAAAARADGTAPFTSVLPGGDRAGLLSVVDEAELAGLALLALAAAEG